MLDKRQEIELDSEYFDEDDEDTQKDKYLTFKIAKDNVGIEIRHVTEIIGPQKITEVPNTPVYVLGIINLRGTVVPVVDVRIRLGMESKEIDDLTCIVVASYDDTTVGLMVDEVQEVLEIPESEINPPPKISKGPAGRFLQGIGKVGDDVKLIFNIKKLLYDEEAEVSGDTA